MKAKKFLSLALLSLMLTSCGNRLTHGKVIKKDVHPEGMTLVAIVLPCGKTICTNFIPIWYPESYSLKVRGVADGKVIEEDFYVTYYDFNKINTGDTYTCDVVKKCIYDRPTGK